MWIAIVGGKERSIHARLCRCSKKALPKAEQQKRKIQVRTSVASTKRKQKQKVVADVSKRQSQGADKLGLSLDYVAFGSGDLGDGNRDSERSRRRAMVVVSRGKTKRAGTIRQWDVERVRCQEG